MIRAAENFFVDFWNDHEIRLSDKYPNSVFYIKNNKVFMEYNTNVADLNRIELIVSWVQIKRPLVKHHGFDSNQSKMLFRYLAHRYMKIDYLDDVVPSYPNEWNDVFV
jgi:hypothetical protein